MLWLLIYSPFKDRMGDALFCERGPFKLEWFLCQEEEDEGFETCPLVFLLDNLERKKSENF